MEFLLMNFEKILKRAQQFRDETLHPRGVMLLALKNNKVLAVAHRNTTNDWEMPGGKVEPGESDLDALVREVFEETNLSIDKEKCTFLTEDLDGETLARTYLYLGTINEIPKQGDIGPVKWVSWDELLNGHYPVYNKKLKRLIDSLSRNNP